MKRRRLGFHGMLAAMLAVMAAVSILLCGSIQAFVIPTGNEDIILRWDNTIKYNFGYRVKAPTDDIINSVNYDDGDRNFAHGIVTNRLDLLTEFDMRFKRDYGFRLSGAFWYDQRYHDSLDNDNVLTSNHMNGAGSQTLGLSGYTDRLYAGPDGELLDAFVFAKFDIGNVPINFKVGRYTIYWGEAMLSNQGISYSQAPIDAGKASAVPGSELKELFRPLAQISATAQLSDKLSLAGQYFLQWEPYRLSESGSYLSGTDMMVRGADSLVLAPGFAFAHTRDGNPDAKKNWGVALRWRPEIIQGTIGFYYRRFADMVPSQVHVDLLNSSYFIAFADNIDLYGVSYTRQVLGISVGADLSWRHNMPLSSEAVMIIPGVMTAPADGDTLGARGNTYHFVINALGLQGKTPLWDSADYLVEMSLNGYSSVTQGENYFKGRDGYTALDRASKNAVGVAINFTPKWLQVFPGMDLSMPMSWSQGISGNSAVISGCDENAGSYSIGLSMDVYQRYTFALAYIGYFGKETIESGSISSFNDPNALIQDRSWISFTFKTTF